MGNTQTYKHRHSHSKHKHSNSNSKHRHNSNSAYSPKKHHQRTRRHRHRHTRKQRGGGFFDFFRGKKSESTAAAGVAAPAVAAPGVPGQGFLASIKGSATDVLGKGNDALVGLNESVSTGVTGKIASIKDTVGAKTEGLKNLFGNSDAPPPTGETQAGGRRRKTNRKRNGRKHKKH